IAIKGANQLQAMGLHSTLILVVIVLAFALVNLLIGSAAPMSALLGAIMVPMLMQRGISAALIARACRVRDSSIDIAIPLAPYFPLIVVFCQKYVKPAGVGTLLALMLPFSITLLVVWSLFLVGYWALGIPLGVGSSYAWPAD